MKYRNRHRDQPQRLRVACNPRHRHLNTDMLFCIVSKFDAETRMSLVSFERRKPHYQAKVDTTLDMSLTTFYLNHHSVIATAQHWGVAYDTHHRTQYNRRNLLHCYMTRYSRQYFMHDSQYIVTHPSERPLHTVIIHKFHCRSRRHCPLPCDRRHSVITHARAHYTNHPLSSYL